MAMTTRVTLRSLRIAVLLYATWMDLVHTGAPRLGCRDRLPREKCLYLKSHSVCQTHPGRMERYCPKTCQFCESTCKDRIEHCDLMAKGALCFRNSFMMERDCAFSCGFCEVKNPCKTHQCTVDEKCYLDRHNVPYCRCYIPQCYENEDTTPLCTTTGEDFPNLCTMLNARCKRRQMMYVDKYTPCKPVTKECKDAVLESKHGLCAKWKSYNFCTKVRPTMERYCNKTCGFCDERENAALARALSPPKRCVSNGYGCCWNDRSKAAMGPRGEGCEECADLRFCARFQMNCGDKHNRSFMKKFCPKCCGYCVPTPCEDKNDYCPSWAEIGECDKNPGYMKLFCRKSCGVC